MTIGCFEENGYQCVPYKAVSNGLKIFGAFAGTWPAVLALLLQSRGLGTFGEFYSQTPILSSVIIFGILVVWAACCVGSATSRCIGFWGHFEKSIEYTGAICTLILAGSNIP